MNEALSGNSSLSDDADLLNISFWTGDRTLDDNELYAGDTACEPLQLDLHTACSLGKYDIAHALIQASANSVNAQNRGGWTPLMYAAYIGHESIVTLLLNHPNVDVNKKNKVGQTPLMLAVSCGNETVAGFLYHAQADLESRDERGWTPLFHATYNGHQNLVKFLCENRAGIDAVEPLHGYTPLMMATNEGHEIIVQYLLENGANWRLKNKQEDTARGLALGKGYMKIVSLIDMYDRAAPRPAPQLEDIAFGMQDMNLNSQHNKARKERELLPQTVKEFLDGLKLSKYLSLFEEQEIDLEVLLTMSDYDLKAIGLKFLGPRRKITSQIARHHSMVKSHADPQEKAYADMLENGMQEMAEKLDTAHREMEQLGQKLVDLDKKLGQEQELRTVTEKLLMEHKGQWETTLYDCAYSRTYCHKVFQSLSTIGQSVAQLKQQCNGRGFDAEESNTSIDAVTRSVATATQTMAVILRNIEKALQYAEQECPS